MTKSQIFILAISMTFILLFFGFSNAAIAIVAFFTVYWVGYAVGFLVAWVMDKLP